MLIKHSPPFSFDALQLRAEGKCGRISKLGLATVANITLQNLHLPIGDKTNLGQIKSSVRYFVPFSAFGDKIEVFLHLKLHMLVLHQKLKMKLCDRMICVWDIYVSKLRLRRNISSANF